MYSINKEIQYLSTNLAIMSSYHLIGKIQTCHMRVYYQKIYYEYVKTERDQNKFPLSPFTSRLSRGTYGIKKHFVFALRQINLLSDQNLRPNHQHLLPLLGQLAWASVPCLDLALPFAPYSYEK